MTDKQTIINFMQQGKKYEYIGEDFGKFKKGRVYKCYVHLPYMILMSYKGGGIKLGLGCMFNYPTNNVENWKESKVKLSSDPVKVIDNFSMGL